MCQLRSTRITGTSGREQRAAVRTLPHREGCAQPSSSPVVTEAHIADAVEAAEQVFDPRSAPSGPAFEPTSINEAQAAVQRLAELFEELPGSIAEALDGARSSGSLLSSDRLQGLAEIVQNADDVKASHVCFLLRPTELLVSHDGTPVRLPHVLGLATPWLSTKAGDARTIGRFGVGLSALQSLSTTLEVHCTHITSESAIRRSPQLNHPLCRPGFVSRVGPRCGFLCSLGP